jgi:hypothetical protein
VLISRTAFTLAALILAAPSPAVFAAPSPPGSESSMDGAIRQRVVSTLARTLEDRYLFPAIGGRYGAMLKTRLQSGAYDTVHDPATLARRLTADLQAVAPDAHLRVGLEQTFRQPRPSPPDLPNSARANGPPGLEEAALLKGGIAYLRFNQFTDDPGAGVKARNFLLAHRDARALIIDCRPNRGGGMTVMNAILPLLYGETTVQVRMDARIAPSQTSPVEAEPGLVRRPSPATIERYDHVVIPALPKTRLRQVPIYYLTSRRTASAAEHLALALKRNHRAILVGETTAGANHFGDEVVLGGGLLAFIPVGRTYDPDTGTDWEGVGITPDIAVHADAALQTAINVIERAAVSGKR